MIGMTGGSGSGKTTLTTSILKGIGEDKASFLQQDSYYKDQSHFPLKIRPTLNFDHLDALDIDLLVEHLKKFTYGYAINKPIYDFETHARKFETEVIYPKEVNIIEGILVLADKRLRGLMDIKIFVDTDADIRFIRRLKRDISERKRTVESVINQYINTVRPMHEAFVEPQKRFADITISGNGQIEDAVSIVLSKIEDMLELK